jgi:CBS domain-containing protein
VTQVVRDVMSSHLVTCAPNTSIRDVAKKMRDEDIGDVVVTEGGQLRGIVTDRDLVVRCLADATADVSNAKISDCLSTDVLTVDAKTTTKEAAKLMAQRSVRRLPVVEDGRPIGIVSLGDLAMERDPKSALAGISAATPNT